MKMTQNYENDFYILPIIRKEDYYVIHDDFDFLDIDNISDNSFLDYLNRKFLKQKGIVNIKGDFYNTFIFVPKEEDDYSYVVLNSTFEPYSSENQMEILREHFSVYLENLRERVSKSDAIVPELSTYLETQYIYPNFKRILNRNTYTAFHWEELYSQPKLVILGDPGVGKTSCLRRIAIEYVNKELDDDKPELIPIYIQLRNWENFTDIFDQIMIHLACQGGDWIKSRLDLLRNSGKLVLLLDGLDEITDDYRRRILENIQRLDSEFPNLRLILTSRKQTYNWELKNFTHILISPFNNNQIKELCYRKLYKKKSWKDFYTAILEEPDLVELVSNPLLLIISLYLYYRNSILPNNKSQIINDFIVALTETWDSARGVNRTIFENVSPIKARIILSKLSYHLMKDQKYSFGEHDLIKWFENDYEKENIIIIIHKISEITGLLKTIEDKNWSFTHQAFVDCLTSNFLVDKLEGFDKYYNSHSKNRKWDKVWFNAGGLTTDPEYLLTLSKKNKNLTNESKSLHFLNILSQSLSINTKVLNETLNYILDSLGNLVRYYNIKSEKVTPDETSHSYTYRLSFHSKKKNIAKEYNLYLTELIKMLYKNRHSSPRDSYLNLISKKGKTDYNFLSTLLKMKGNLIVSEEVLDNRTIIYFDVFAESPSIDYE